MSHLRWPLPDRNVSASPLNTHRDGRIHGRTYTNGEHTARARAPNARPLGPIVPPMPGIGAPPTSAPAPLRVCMVTSTLPLGGAESLQMSVLGGLNRAGGYACQVLCLRTAGEMAPLFEDAGVPVTVHPRHRWQHLSTVPVLARWLRAQRIDVVLTTTHVPSLHLALVAARLARVKGTVLGLHQTGGRAIGLPSLPRRSVDLLFLLDALVLLSRHQLDYIRSSEGYGRLPWRRAPFAIIPNGVSVPAPAAKAARSEARAALGLPYDAQVVGCVAALRPEKDHETLLRAVSRLADTHPELRLVLVGSGPREHELRDDVSRRGLDGRVVFTGFRSDVDRLLPALDVFCLTSVQETYPVSVLEAMAAGVPVVMTDCEGVPDIVQEGRTGWKVPVGDDALLARRVSMLLDDPVMARTMGEAGRSRAASSYSLETTVERYGALFRALAGDPNAPVVRRRR